MKLVKESLNEFLSADQLFPKDLKGKPSEKETIAKNKAREQLKELINENNGWILLGLVHHFYGPLRGTAFNIRAGDIGIEELLDFIQETQDPINASRNIQEWLAEIHSIIGIMPTVMILPSNMAETAEKTVENIKSVDEFMSLSLQSIKDNAEDIYYHRSGIH